MAGLEALDETEPTGSRNLLDGDNAIRETRQKTKESVDKEHTLDGYHTIPMGTIVTRPLPGASHIGRFYLLQVTNSNEIQAWDGLQWVNFTRNQETEANTASISEHQTSNPIDHVDESITRDKLKPGLLAKKHFIVGSSDNALIDELVDGSVTTLHTHPAQSVVYPNSIFTFLETKIVVVSSSGNIGWTTIGNGISSQLPNGVKGVILEASGKAAPQKEILESSLLDPKILIRSTGSSEMVLIGGEIEFNNLYSGITAIGWRGQGMFPINTSKKFDYKVTDFNKSWEIRIVGYYV